ncbi:MAG: trafficking protein particle complex subunit 4 [bacterium]|jgi:hypothetical protein
MSGDPSAPSAPRTGPSREQRKPPATNVIYAFWIVGRNGGLLYSKDIQPAAAPIDFNDKLRLASSWFGMCGISTQLAPDPSDAGVAGGVHVLKADTFDLHSFQSLTGVTFMLITSPGYRGAGGLLQGDVYRLYCDYVLKNPFHEAEQVIKSDLFDGKIVQLLHGVS